MQQVAQVSVTHRGHSSTDLYTKSENKKKCVENVCG